MTILDGVAIVMAASLCLISARLAHMRYSLNRIAVALEKLNEESSE